MLLWIQLIVDLIFLVLVTGITLYIATVVYTCGRWELPYVPTMRRAKKALAVHLKLGKGDTVLDMGSGLGSMLSHFAKSPAKVIGIERHPFFALLSRLRMAMKPWRWGKTRVERGDFFQADLSRATHIYCFHIPKLIGRLAHKFEEELTVGQTLISYKFPYPLSPAFEVESFEDAPGSSFYVYRKKPHISLYCRFYGL